MTDIWAYIRGQEHVKRALEVALAGSHSILLVGPAGAGKTLLAHTLDTLVGALVVDDVPDLSRRALISLRRQLTLQAGEGDGTGPGLIRWPAVVCTARPCACGYYGDPERECTCSAALVARYRAPLREIGDHIDLHIEVPSMSAEKLLDQRVGEPWAAAQARIEEARARQEERGVVNARLDPQQVLSVCALDEAGRALLRSAIRQLSLSARGYHRILKVARTIADLAASERIQVAYLAEAVQYRPRL